MDDKQSAVVQISDKDKNADFSTGGSKLKANRLDKIMRKQLKKLDRENYFAGFLNLGSDS